MTIRSILLFASMCLSSVAFAQSADEVQWGVPRDNPPQYQGGTYSDPPPGMEPESMRFMAGAAMECKNVISGTYKCCRQPVPNQEGVWWKTYKEATRQSQAHAVACGANKRLGGWAEYNETADFRTLQQRTTGEQENLDGGGATVGCDDSQSIEQMQESFMEKEDSTVRPDLPWYCDEQEFQLAVRRNVGQCSYVGTKCVSDVFGMCLVEKEVYCCFNSPVSKEIREAQLAPGARFGTAKEPMCDGLTAEEVSQLNLTSVPLKNVMARMQAGDFLDSPTDANLEAELTGSASAMGNAGRKTYSERTDERMGHLQYEGEQTAVEDSMKVVLPTTTTDAPTGPGHLTFTVANGVSGCDRWMALEVSRDGGVGAVSATVQSPNWGNPGVAFEAFQPTKLTWADGDTSNKLVRIRMLHPDTPVDAVFDLVDATGGATLAPYWESIIKVNCSQP